MEQHIQLTEIQQHDIISSFNDIIHGSKTKVSISTNDCEITTYLMPNIIRCDLKLKNNN